MQKIVQRLNRKVLENIFNFMATILSITRITIIKDIIQLKIYQTFVWLHLTTIREHKKCMNVRTHDFRFNFSGRNFVRKADVRIPADTTPKPSDFSVGLLDEFQKHVRGTTLSLASRLAMTKGQPRPNC